MSEKLSGKPVIYSSQIKTDRCEIQIAYAIGVAEPTSLYIDTFGTGKIPDKKLIKLVQDNFDLRPYGIIKMLDLLHPIYQQTASYG